MNEPIRNCFVIPAKNPLAGMGQILKFGMTGVAVWMHPAQLQALNFCQGARGVSSGGVRQPFRPSNYVVCVKSGLTARFGNLEPSANGRTNALNGANNRAGRAIPDTSRQSCGSTS